MTDFTLSADDVRLLAALRDGDESAFATLLEWYHMALVRLATIFVSDQAVAEEVVQETWIAVLQGLDRFEGRSSLKTWIYSILTNRAKTRAQREGRAIPFSMLADADGDPDEPSVDPDRFNPAGVPEPGHWADQASPSDWDAVPEVRLLSQETGEIIQHAISQLPPNQRDVITLRDVAGWSSDEVCNVLGLSETNQRVLLHRARSKVRGALEKYLDQE